MHIPKKFQQDDPAQLRDIIVNYPFASLVTHSEQGLEVSHLPFYLNQSEGKDILQGHIARANPLWKSLGDQSEVLVVFHGPNCYISPNHYPTKQETGKAVPTWNYIAVHAKGVLSFIQDAQWNLGMLNNLTSQHEAGRADAWSLADAPAGYIERMLPAIVGIEIEVRSITGQWKLSQNQPEVNRQGVITGLYQETNTDSHKVAELVAGYQASKPSP
ncbi:FMN-binding negative transcriptional regulator [Aestuariirhabdus sp. Z084]|uniref:FMN-binding negative transcriptional regulator n=1 Tax=Aestuariirhabdus haliotis TaxID=2918751 RepID=UPI00201B3C42|nr:FMN-binding negative transcriptional regulator [Aestuariirhabdus haliotis]MCL6417826.1 FMN-binding negative transcriptional regulator [Aestuariirhabdus haliotis]MCL6421742.1 FMN-binding negative transcriptional regulator [Aestuariirhabdus haliotis]